MDTEIQFDRVERPISATACTSCRGALLGSYFQANGQILCERCAEGIRKFFHSGEGAFGRVIKAIAFGIGGGLAGGAIYTTVLALVHINAALITILIGFWVGKMVRKGSGNRGGIGYQLLAVIITYGMIGLSIILSEMLTSSAANGGLLNEIFLLLFGAIAGPVIAATHSPLGGLITFFGLMQAWKINKSVVVNITGPHALAPVTPSRDPVDPMIAQNPPAPVTPSLPPQSA
ncbi:hypothetical protein [Chthoniobacter flavus]|nr:hypothetical protein [Chthoniobacter flavus]